VLVNFDFEEYTLRRLRTAKEEDEFITAGLNMSDLTVGNKCQSTERVSKIVVINEKSSVYVNPKRS
jgi:hypothetical protein